jgi:integrase
VVLTADVKLCFVFLDYVARVRQKGGNEKTIKNVTRACAIFQDWLNRQGLDCVAVTYDHLVAFDVEASEGHAEGTRIQTMKQLRAAYSWAVKRGALAASPFDLWIMPKPTAKKKVVIPSAELARMRQDCRDSRALILWGLLTYTGMRRDEIRRLTWEDIDDSWTATILGKGGKERAVPIHPELQAILHAEGRKPGAVLRPYVTSPEPYLSYRRVLLQFAGERTPHDFRKTVASSLAANGVRTEHILSILGWNVPGVFGQFYLTVNPKELHEAIRGLYADDPLVIPKPKPDELGASLEF